MHADVQRLQIAKTAIDVPICRSISLPSAATSAAKPDGVQSRIGVSSSLTPARRNAQGGRGPPADRWSGGQARGRSSGTRRPARQCPPKTRCGTGAARPSRTTSCRPGAELHTNSAPRPVGRRRRHRVGLKRRDGHHVRVRPATRPLVRRARLGLAVISHNRHAIDLRRRQTRALQAGGNRGRGGATGPLITQSRRPSRSSLPTPPRQRGRPRRMAAAPSRWRPEIPRTFIAAATGVRR